MSKDLILQETSFRQICSLLTTPHENLQRGGVQDVDALVTPLPFILVR